MKQAPITKVTIITRDNERAIQLLKQNFKELENWRPDAKADFDYSVWLGDKTYLIIINVVKQTTAQHLAEFKVN
jgi:hypothetical protein